MLEVELETEMADLLVEPMERELAVELANLWGVKVLLALL